jgi:hypothetical protein
VVTEEVTSDLVKDTVEGGRRLFLSLGGESYECQSLDHTHKRMERGREGEWREDARGCKRVERM